VSVTTGGIADRAATGGAGGSPLRAAAARAARRAPLADGAHAALLAAAAGSVFAVVLLLVYETWRGALPSLQAFGLRFFIGTEWDPVAGRFGALPYLVGTLTTSALAMILAVPASLGAAVYLTEMAPRRVDTVLSYLIELLASIPSIVYGLWGIFVLAPVLRGLVEPWLIAHFGFLPLFQGFPFGLGVLNAGIVLAIMVLPTIVSLAREVLRAMPPAFREAALALGATRAEAIGVVLAGARPGLMGAIVLGLGRALGETMAVTMVIGNSNRLTASLLAPGATMASVIANEFTEATEKLHTAALIEIALALFVVTFVLNGIARLVLHRMTKGVRDVAGAA